MPSLPIKTRRVRRSAYLRRVVLAIAFYIALYFIVGAVVGAVMAAVHFREEFAFLAAPLVLYPPLALAYVIVQSIRRLNDVDKSGFWIFVPIYNVMLLARAGTPGPNPFSDDPRGGNVSPNVVHVFE